VSDEVLTAEEVAQLLGFEGKHPRRFVHRLPIPQVRLSDRRIRYLRADVFDYIRRKRYGAPQIAR
jgi:predicted DNA-binding transcriptional regulator AlpA